MSKTKQILAELTEDHPVFKAAMAAYDGVRTIQAKKTVMDIVKATLETCDGNVISKRG